MVYGFPRADAVVGAAARSDHSPLWILLKKPEMNSHKKRIFWYEAQWAGDKECTAVIKKEWRMKGTVEDTWKHLNRNLDRCKRSLMKWQSYEGRNSLNCNKVVLNHN